jgi:hypothetical protein
MGTVTHWVNKFNWTALIATAMAGGFFLAGVAMYCAAIKARPPTPGDTLVVSITNEGHKSQVKAYRVEDGKLIPVK